MAYKSNRQSRAEYLANEAKNREMNRRNSDRRKARSASRGRTSTFGKVIFLVMAFFLFMQYLKHRSAPTEQRVFVSAPSRR
jgi:hypothetical protein